MHFDFESERATKDWLTHVLIRNQYLASGAVDKVKQRKAQLGPGISATLYSLDLEYSSNSSGDRPARLLMKVSRPTSRQPTSGPAEDALERHTAWMLLTQTHRDAILRKEAILYESVRDSNATLPMVICYGSEIHPQNHRTCVLLEDLSDSHFQPLWPIPAEGKECEKTVDALARLHGHWWESKEFGSIDFPHVTDGDIDEIIEVYRKSYAQLSHLLGDRLNDQRRSIYRDALARLPMLMKERMGSSQNLTLVHGDAHHWNVLLPKSGTRVAIFDWQTWHIDTGAHDLAYLMGIQWFSEHRHRQEKALLERYCKSVKALGINFSRDELTFDYRLSVIRHLFTPVLFSSFVTPAVWWPQLDRVFCAFSDWKCIELLD